MLQGWTVIAVAVAYIGFLFAIASYGDKLALKRPAGHGRPIIYALTLGVYCTSWTFFGSVGLAAKTGYDFLPIYLGPILTLSLGWPILRRIVRLSKEQNITSIADFIAARYGKNQALAAIVAVIAVLGTVPYISLQLKAVSASVTTLFGDAEGNLGAISSIPLFGDIAFITAVGMAIFAILFGTRHIDATEHQEGLMLAIATESIVKLFAFIFVGMFITYSMFDGVGDLVTQVQNRPEIANIFNQGFVSSKWTVMTLLSIVAIILLPRQFHVAVVECDNENDTKKAAWLFPIYLIAINLFVVPIAAAGLLSFPSGNVDADMFVVALPSLAGQDAVSLIAFIGGLSAATAMVIIATVALSIMVCNDLVMPIVLRGKPLGIVLRKDMGGLLLNIRRTAIFGIILLSYLYYQVIGSTFALASIGLLSFAAIAQFAPAFFGGLVWRRATARGAIAGIMTGFGVWAYTLLLPSFINSGWFSAEILAVGPFGIELLRPQHLFNIQTLLGPDIDPLTHGVLWSLVLNFVAYVGFSLMRKPLPIERLQANIFVNADMPTGAPGFRLWRTAITVHDLKETVARYLGEQRTERSFKEFAAEHNIELTPTVEADIRVLRFAEYLLASAVGAPSSRLILTLLIERNSLDTSGAMKLLDDASAAIQYNRDLLQSAIDHVGQGISVFDKDLRLICWNRQFRDLLNLPQDIGRVGVPLQEIVRFSAENGDLGPGDVEDLVSDRIQRYVVTMETFQEHVITSGTVVEVRTNAMPDGGLVMTYGDITQRVEAAEALKRANETLERRVRERTRELTSLNVALAKAKGDAEQANIGKTRFLAAASHDILQPLNAARLYTTSLSERQMAGLEGQLTRNIDASLEAVEEILSDLLDISRLDAGALKPERTTFRIDELFSALEVEFSPLADERGIDLKFMPCSLAARTDRRLVRRVLQNFISNAIKYTPEGRALVGCRRRGTMIEIGVYDTGLGIPEDKQTLIFGEFQRLDSAVGFTPGIGLGLSIVERIVEMLDHQILLKSTPDKGSVFSILLPLAAFVPAAKRQTADLRTKTTDFEGLTVLCIDNEQSILDGMETLLTGWGCNVLSGRDLEDATTQIRKAGRAPDILLADYHLTNANGIDLIQQLRATLDHELPAILVTADRSQARRDEARLEGVAILNKPVKPAALRALIAQSRVHKLAAE